MVYFVDVLVQRAPVERTMRPVMPRVLQHKKHSDLVPVFPSAFNSARHKGGHYIRGPLQNCEERGERYAGSKPNILSHWVEEPDTVNELPHIWTIELI